MAKRAFANRKSHLVSKVVGRAYTSTSPPSPDLPVACDTYRRHASRPHPSGTCDMQSRSCLMQPAYQELACCRIEACNTWTTAPGILLYRMRRCARPAPAFAIGGVCMTAMRCVRLHDYRHKTIPCSAFGVERRPATVDCQLSTGHASLRDMHKA
jgi:hypothetical protein